ncbi:hypothetical protein EYC59_02510 [Candidatus Saccharibacteria bacterium]|nr:MAG: hypothetical protein EYC59_02510 [Candidatus Saccharibacteria bacterium]
MMKVHLAEADWGSANAAFREQYVGLLTNAYEDVTELLPFGSSQVNFFVQPRAYNLIDETHDNGHTHNSEFIEIAFDPEYFVGQPEAVLKSHIQGTVFHEMNHAARYNLGIWHESFLDSCLLEGLATVFEREYAETTPLWGAYPSNCDEWLQEVQRLGEGIDTGQYMFAHEDGRKWIGYKIGTYLVDQALQRSGKTIVELTQLTCSDIMNLAGVKE